MHIYTHPEFLNHEVAEGHAERPERLSHLLAHLQREGILSDSPLRQPNDVSDAQILAAHSLEHLQFLRSSAPSEGVVPLDPDTWMSKASMNAARLAAGQHHRRPPRRLCRRLRRWWRLGLRRGRRRLLGC